MIGDGGDFVSFAGKFVEPKRPGGWLDPGPYGCLGAGLGSAIAARLARPSAQVVLLLGDGAAGFSLMDVDTLVRHNLPVVMVMGNNSAWGLEKGPMQMLYGYDVAADLAERTAYHEVVKALGGAGEMVTDPKQIGPALDRAFARASPTSSTSSPTSTRRTRATPSGSRHADQALRPEEHAEIGAITVAAYEPFLPGAEDHYREQLADVAGRDRDAEVWVATPDDSDEHPRQRDRLPAGFVLARDRPRTARASSGCSRWRPTAQGQGVGMALAEIVVERFRSDGAAGWCSPAWSMDGAHRIYDRLGFHRDPDRDWSPAPGVHLIAYSLEL